MAVAGVRSGGEKRRRGFSASFDAVALLEDRIYARSTPEKFWASLDKNGPTLVRGLGPCWLWTGSFDVSGYGRVTWCRVNTVAHRVSYSLTHGPIHGGQVVRHMCDNAPCCNPSHLTIGTIADNNADACARGRNNTSNLRHDGVNNCKAKLTDALVVDLRAAWAYGAGESIKSIAERTGLAQGTIHPMVHGRTWKHVPMPARDGTTTMVVVSTGGRRE